MVRKATISKRRRPARKRNPRARHQVTKSPKPLPERPFPNPLAICKAGPDGWTLLVNPDTAGAIAVNPTGALIWRLVNGKRTVRDIVAGVRRRFTGAPRSVSRDVTALLAAFAEADLIGEELTSAQRRKTRDQGPGTKNR